MVSCSEMALMFLLSIYKVETLMLSRSGLNPMTASTTVFEVMNTVQLVNEIRLLISLRVNLRMSVCFLHALMALKAFKSRSILFESRRFVCEIETPEMTDL